MSDYQQTGADAKNNKQGVTQRVAGSMAGKAQEILKEDLGKAKDVAFDAAKSRAYLYPIKGIYYFLTHRELWKPFTSKLGPYISLSVTVIGGMFAVSYAPQLAVMVFVDGPLAVFTTALLVLNESSTIINNVAKAWFLQEALLDTFDGTLVARNNTNIVREGREIKSGSDPMAKLGKILKSPFERYSPKAFIRYFLYLPLNFIPIVGTVIFISLQGRTKGQYAHDRYFQLKKWSSSQKSEWLKKHTGPYTAFGLVATLLEMVPIASIFFTYTNTVGAALWAADIEAMNTSMTDSTAPALREAADNAN